MPDPEVDVEAPAEDAAEQAAAVAAPAPDPLNEPAGPALDEAAEADLAEQRSVVDYDEDDYR